MSSDALILAIEAGGYKIDRRSGPRGNRLERAKKLARDGLVHNINQTPEFIEAVINYRHTARIRLDDKGRVIDVRCTCQDWRTRGLHYSQPCKHILALALEIGAAPTAVPEPASDDAARPAEPSLFSFPQDVRRAINQAIQALASRVEALLLAGETPFLLGPTGSGKTSAIRLVAIRQGWGYEEVAGSPSFVDGDLVGLKTDRMESPGVLARAFRRAQAGETVLLCVDELTRFNARVPDLLMRPLQVAPVEIARRMGLPADEAVRLCEAPTWGQIWAPARQIKFVLAANPWGAALDSALLRRVTPLEVTFAPNVLQLFTSPVRDAIEASWKAEAKGQLPLPVEYQALLAAASPDDASLFRPYLARLRALDQAAAGGFATLLKGIGLEIPE